MLGNTVLPLRDVERAVYPFLGPSKSLADVQGARKSLEDIYHQRGYGTVFVDIPEQDVNRGVVRLKVTEGRLAAAAVSGAKYFSEREVRDALPEASEGKVPNFVALQGELAQVNSVTGDRVVTPILKAGALPGTVDLTLHVDDHLPFHGSVELNNQYTADTSSLRSLWSFGYDNMFGRQDSFSLQYQVSPQHRDEVSVFVANYLARIGDNQLAFYYLDSSSNVATLEGSAGSAGAGSLLVLGRGHAGGVRLFVPLENSSSLMQTLSFAVEYKDFLQAIGPGSTSTDGSSGSLQTPIRYTDLSLGYSGNWLGTIRRSFDISANFGLRQGSGNALEFEDKRFNARPNFFYLRSNFSTIVPLPREFTFLWRIAGQYASEPLVSNEQFAIAGSDGVRGYLEAEVLSDTALKTTFQLGTPKLRLWSNGLSSDAFVFFDWGKTHLIDPLPGEAGSDTLRSWGVGLNVLVLNHLSGSLTWARALADSTLTHSGDSRLLFSMRGFW